MEYIDLFSNGEFDYRCITGASSELLSYEGHPIPENVWREKGICQSIGWFHHSTVGEALVFARPRTVPERKFPEEKELILTSSPIESSISYLESLANKYAIDPTYVERVYTDDGDHLLWKSRTDAVYRMMYISTYVLHNNSILGHAVQLLDSYLQLPGKAFSNKHVITYGVICLLIAYNLESSYRPRYKIKAAHSECNCSFSTFLKIYKDIQKSLGYAFLRANVERFIVELKGGATEIYRAQKMMLERDSLFYHPIEIAQAALVSTGYMFAPSTRINDLAQRMASQKASPSPSAFTSPSIQHRRFPSLKYEITGNILGSGVCGEVREGRREDGSFAIKQISTFEETDDIREISFLTELDHPNIIKLVDVIADNETFMVLEKMDSSLFEFQVDDVPMLKSFMRQIFEGLNYIHSRKIIHGDLKSMNILQRNKKEVKIADFGSACFKTNDNDTTGATVWWRAPEEILGAVSTFAIDIWAAGLIMIELIRGEHLFKGSDEQETQLLLYFSVLGTPTEKVWPGLVSLSNYRDYVKSAPMFNPQPIRTLVPDFEDVQGLDLLRRLLQFDPERRISAQEALKHPFLN